MCCMRRCCHDKTDCSASFKILMVVFWCGCMVCHYGAYRHLCISEYGPKMDYYDPWAPLVGNELCHDSSSSRSLYYLVTYLGLSMVSIAGFVMVCCSCVGCNKFYSLILVLTWAWLTFEDYWVMTRALKALSGYTKAQFTFQLEAIWLAESYLFLTTAYDAWDRSDVKPDRDNYAPIMEPSKYRLDQRLIDQHNGMEP